MDTIPQETADVPGAVPDYERKAENTLHYLCSIILLCNLFSIIWFSFLKTQQKNAGKLKVAQVRVIRFRRMLCWTIWAKCTSSSWTWLCEGKESKWKNSGHFLLKKLFPASFFRLVFTMLLMQNSVTYCTATIVQQKKAKQGFII